MSDNSVKGQMLEGWYPQSWDEFVGQHNAKRALQVAARSARMRNDNLPHILITSPFPGVGKTAIALRTIHEAGRRVFLASGMMKLSDARLMFAKVSDGDIVFYDEFHKIMDGGKKNAEWLLNYLENGLLLTPFGQEKVPRVSFIGATTDKGLLPAAILDRFKIVQLDPYTDEEGTAIAKSMGAKVFGELGMPKVNALVAAAVARAASNQPRRMRDLLISIRDLAVVGEIPTPRGGRYDLTEALSFADLTEDGLTRDCREYLHVMHTELRAEPAGAALMRERLGIVGKGLVPVEQLLLDKGLIVKTKQGRVLTDAGIKRAMALAEELENAA
jgi:Holliday junction DNA helicase RuvB